MADQGGVMHGSVSVLSELGFGYVVEPSTGRQFFIAREHLGAQIYDAISVGDQVEFVDNGHGVVAGLKVITTRERHALAA